MNHRLSVRIAAVAVATSALLCPLLAGAGERLHVRAGDTYQMPASRADLVFDEWVLEDGATIQLPASAGSWRIEVRNASLGNRVSIRGVGAAGADGASGRSHTEAAANCRAGKEGGAGAHGAAGGSGATLNLSLAIARLGDLNIDVSGGRGGLGGAGGTGQDGGKPDQCNGGDGGRGGDGGDGGDGGNGGSVRLSYSFLPGSGLDEGVGTRISVVNAAGEPGSTGAGGKGGKGSEGHYVQMHTLAGNQKWIGGGEPGADGQPGKPGRVGIQGQAAIERDLSQRIDELMRARASPTVPASVPAPAAGTALKALEAKVDQLLKRIEALEKSR